MTTAGSRDHRNNRTTIILWNWRTMVVIVREQKSKIQSTNTVHCKCNGEWRSRIWRKKRNERKSKMVEIHPRDSLPYPLPLPALGADYSVEINTLIVRALSLYSDILLISSSFLNNHCYYDKTATASYFYVVSTAHSPRGRSSAGEADGYSDLALCKWQWYLTFGYNHFSLERKRYLQICVCLVLSDPPSHAVPATYSGQIDNAWIMNPFIVVWNSACRQLTSIQDFRHNYNKYYLLWRRETTKKRRKKNDPHHPLY